MEIAGDPWVTARSASWLDSVKSLVSSDREEADLWCHCPAVCPPDFFLYISIDIICKKKYDALIFGGQYGTSGPHVNSESLALQYRATTTYARIWGDT